MKPVRVISRYPRDKDLKDGMMQRVFDLDNLLSKRIVVEYIHISFTKNLRLKKFVIENFEGRTVTEYKLNMFVHFFTLLRFLGESSVVVCHSVMNYAYIYAALLLVRVPLISDIHGAVPEEHIEMGKLKLAKIYSCLERSMFKKSRGVIGVSQAMIDFYKKKYRLLSSIEMFFVPIISSENILVSQNNKLTDNVNVIYAGGTQTWQNVQLMLDNVCVLSKQYPLWKFSFYFPDESLGMMQMAATNLPAQISTASRENLSVEYSKSHLGFLLREDTTVNRVSSPTKLSEYLSFGIIPIVIQPHVGDLTIRQYKYFLLEDLINGKDIDHNEIIAMKIHNLELHKKNHIIDIEFRQRFEEYVHRISMNESI
ncbi:glycosyltransferase [Deinococcus radiopugnans]|uniref:glycosyltransferase n=1 Tax=Deinococcus radiopugnans TaxID=57497 RepID=UPI0012E0C07B|nr:glycosyltransferase [Deinococcus radiopugnans]